MRTHRILAAALICLLALCLAPVAMAAGQGSYKLVGLGPAGLDLMTPRQIEAVRQADVVFCSPRTQKMLAPAVDFSGKKVLDGYGLIFPFYGKPCPKGEAAKRTRRGKTCEQFHQKQAEFAEMVRQAVGQGKKVVMTTGGDPTIYGPGIWTVLALKDINPTVVPGLSAFNAANAALKAGLGEVIITAPFSKKGRADSLEDLAGHQRATMVIFMPRDMDKLLARLAKAYPADTPMGVVASAGDPDRQKVILGTVGDMGPKLAGVKAMRCLVYVGKALGRSAYDPVPKKSKGKFYLVGVGPGDSDLATLRALEVIKKADLIFAGRRIKELFAKELAGKKVVSGYHRLFPFYGRPCPKKGEQPPRRERMSCEQYHQKQAEFAKMVRDAVAKGQTVAQLDSGDPMVYGPCNWCLTELKDIDTEVVPGMSCFNAANAALGAPVTEGKKSHSVLLASGWSVEDMSRHQATMVLFTMRTDFQKFVNALSKHYAADTPVAIVFNAGYADSESVMRGTLGSITSQIQGKRLPFQHLLYVGDSLTNQQPY